LLKIVKRRIDQLPVRRGSPRSKCGHTFRLFAASAGADSLQPGIADREIDKAHWNALTIPIPALTECLVE
jgi:hypothetical protein